MEGAKWKLEINGLERFKILELEQRKSFYP
jgi:hypothetical protein